MGVLSLALPTYSVYSAHLVLIIHFLIHSSCLFSQLGLVRFIFSQLIIINSAHLFS